MAVISGHHSAWHGLAMRGTASLGMAMRGRGYNVAVSTFAEGAFRYRVPRGTAGFGVVLLGKACHGEAWADSAFSHFLEVVERCGSIMWHGGVWHGGQR